ncbi:MAG TPA: hypothetical protein VFT29_09950 [Gemmatimonadaceae bacterium]|nr:hypothetical protein [Gemmatimonadaceae bacterium]
MNEHLRERIVRKLDALTDERGYQILDYVEFLESKYAERQNPSGNAFTRFTEAVEDRMRAGKVSAAAIAETMGLLNRAANVLNGAVAAGKSVASDIVTAAQSMTPRPGGPSGTSAAPPTTSASTTTGPQTPPPKEASSPAHDVEHPGSGEERL